MKRRDFIEKTAASSAFVGLGLSLSSFKSDVIKKITILHKLDAALYLNDSNIEEIDASSMYKKHSIRKIVLDKNFKLKKINPKINCQFLHLEGTEKDYTVAQMKRLKKMFPKSKILID